MTGVSRIVTGDLGTNLCAIKNDGRAECWGSTFYTSSYSVTPPASVGEVDDIAITAIGYICARTTAGAVSCWGNTAEVPTTIPTIFR